MEQNGSFSPLPLLQDPWESLTLSSGPGWRPEGDVQIQTCNGGKKIMGSNYCSLMQLIKLIYAMSGISYQNKSVNTGN